MINSALTWTTEQATVFKNSSEYQVNVSNRFWQDILWQSGSIINILFTFAARGSNRFIQILNSIELFTKIISLKTVHLWATDNNRRSRERFRSFSIHCITDSLYQNYIISVLAKTCTRVDKTHHLDHISWRILSRLRHTSARQKIIIFCKIFVKNFEENIFKLLIKIN